MEITLDWFLSVAVLLLILFLIVSMNWPFCKKLVRTLHEFAEEFNSSYVETEE